jgi:4-aminobutyrate--pyruvate transaminase
MVDRANSLQARDIAYNPHPFTNLAMHCQSQPLILSRGKGVLL